MIDRHDDINPDRIIKGGSGISWFLCPMIAVCLLAVIVGLWYLLAPQSLALLYGRLTNKPLEVRSLVLTVDRRPLEIAVGGSVEIHPGQSFAVSGLNTSRWLNYDLTLASPDFNIAAVVNGASASPVNLLGEKAFEAHPREMRIEVRDQDKPVAVFKIISRFSALDFAARADAAVDPAVRAENYQRAFSLDPDSETLRDKLAAALVASNQRDRAAELLEAELTRLGADYNILSDLLDLYIDMDQAERQIDTLARMIDLSVQQRRPYLDLMRQMAETYHRDGRPDQAAEVFEEMLEKAPKEQAPVILGDLLAIYRENGRQDQEISTLKRLLEVSPPEQGAAIWNEIVTLYENSGDDTGRLEAWKALAQLLPPGQDKINAYKIIARLLTKAGRHEEAIETYKSVLKLNSADKNTLVNLARLSAAVGDRKAYHSYLGQSLEVDPEDAALRRELADAYRADGQNPGAVTEYRELLKRTPEDQAARLLLIDLLEKMNDRKGLAAQYGELSALNPQDAVIAYNHGALLFETGQIDQAIEAFKKLSVQDPKDSAVHEYLLAAYQKKNKTTEMLDQAMELYRLDPSKTVYLTLMLNTHENAKDWAKFEAVALEAAKIKPDDPESWRRLLKAQNSLNKKEDAAETLWKIAETTKDKAGPWLTAAQALARLNQNDRAIEAYQKALELDPKNEKAAKALLDLKIKSAAKPKD